MGHYKQGQRIKGLLKCRKIYRYIQTQRTNAKGTTRIILCRIYLDYLKPSLSISRLQNYNSFLETTTIFLLIHQKLQVLNENILYICQSLHISKGLKQKQQSNCYKQLKTKLLSTVSTNKSDKAKDQTFKYSLQ